MPRNPGLNDEAPLGHGSRPAWCSSVLAAGFGLERKAILSDSCGMVAERFPQLQSLSSEEKLILVGELWNQLAADPAAFPKRDDHVKLIETRLAHLKEHPHDVVVWEEVKKRILSSP